MQPHPLPAKTSDPPIPEIFVLWHPNCPLGEKLARRIYAWLRPNSGLGPEVFYRTLPGPRAPLSGLPPALRGESRYDSSIQMKGTATLSNLHVVFPLIDENMVVDHTWRNWLTSLASCPSFPSKLLLPVALDQTAYNMPAPLQELNYLRPAGLPSVPGQDITDTAFETIARSLLKQITEALCRLMLSRTAANQLPADQVQANPKSLANEPSPKISLFLSHAKRDGTVPAGRLRDYIYSQTQLAAFYDENDIAYGSAFGRVIKSSLDSLTTAAFIAIRSAAYASRSWCRRELAQFRTPQPETTPPSSCQRWRLYPSVVVEAMRGGQISAGIPEIGNSSIVRWADDQENLEELIVTTVMRDVMLALYHSATGARILEVLESLQDKPDCMVINWLPDPTTLLRTEPVKSGREIEVIYPGCGLSGLELYILEEFFPRITFRSFEQVLL